MRRKIFLEIVRTCLQRFSHSKTNLFTLVLNKYSIYVQRSIFLRDKMHHVYIRISFKIRRMCRTFIYFAKFPLLLIILSVMRLAIGNFRQRNCTFFNSNFWHENKMQVKRIYNKASKLTTVPIRLKQDKSQSTMFSAT